MADTNYLDTSIILSYLLEGDSKELFESEQSLFASSLSLFELKKILLKRKVPDKIINEKVSYMKSRINIISTDHKIAEKAAEISVKNDLSMTDALIYAAALLNGAILLTLDNDLRGLPNAKVL